MANRGLKSSTCSSCKLIVSLARTSYLRQASFIFTFGMRKVVGRTIFTDNSPPNPIPEGQGGQTRRMKLGEIRCRRIDLYDEFLKADAKNGRRPNP